MAKMIIDRTDAEFRRLWMSEMPASIIAKRFGVTKQRVKQMRDRLGLPAKPSAEKRRRSGVYAR